MHNLKQSANRFPNLLDATSAPSFIDDTLSPLTHLGTSVGDDAAPAGPMQVLQDLTLLGPSVGDDGGLRLTELGPSVGDDGSVSDCRLKRNVKLIGRTVFGLKLYQFNYVDQCETHEGVMAQEVLNVMPSAVSVGADGFYRVNYQTLGVA